MAGPFPGMDPYLEHPGLWPGVHPAFITHLRPVLNAALLPRYVAEMGERLLGRGGEPGAHPILNEQQGETAVKATMKWALITVGSLLLDPDAFPAVEEAR